MNGPYLWDWGPPQPTNDATPGGSGASANKRNVTPNSTRHVRPPAHHNAPPGTSEVAARRITGVAGTMRDRVYAAIVEAGLDGLTDDEGEALLGMKPQTYTPRRNELVRDGLVRDSGQRRPTSSGRPAAVWVAASIARNTPRTAPAASSPTDAPEGDRA